MRFLNSEYRIYGEDRKAIHINILEYLKVSKEIDRRGFFIRCLLIAAVSVVLVLKVYLLLFVMDFVLGLYTFFSSFILLNILMARLARPKRSPNGFEEPGRSKARSGAPRSTRARLVFVLQSRLPGSRGHRRGRGSAECWPWAPSAPPSCGPRGEPRGRALRAVSKSWISRSPSRAGSGGGPARWSCCYAAPARSPRRGFDVPPRCGPG